MTDLVGIPEEHSKAVLQHLQECLFAGELVFLKEVKVGLVSTCMYHCFVGPLRTFVLQISTRGVGGFGRSHQGRERDRGFPKRCTTHRYWLFSESVVVNHFSHSVYVIISTTSVRLP